MVSEVKLVCTYCNIFVLNETTGERRANLQPETKLDSIPDDWKCPVCSYSKRYLKEISDADFAKKKARYDELYPLDEGERAKRDLAYYRSVARQKLAGVCAVNKVCDGDPDRLCMGTKYGKPIGFGGAGQGTTFYANFLALTKHKLKTKVVQEHREPEMETTFLGKKIIMPVMVTSFSGTAISMNNAVSEEEFQRGIIAGAKISGTIGMSGNTADFPDNPGVEIIKEYGGWGISVFKPQSQERLLQLFRRAEKAGVIAIGVDLDGFGSTNWALKGKPLYRKSEKDLKELVDATEKPVIYKGIMNVEDAAKVVDSGAKAVDVSNHGGRVLDHQQGVAEVLPEITEEFKGKIAIMADGCIRTGFDVLKILALGADTALLGRPIAQVCVAGGPPAVKMYLDYVKKDLRMAMIMTGCNSLNDVSKKILTE